MKSLCLSILLLLSYLFSTAQTTNDYPYSWNWKTDGIITGAGLAGATGGLLLIRNKKDLSMSELESLTMNVDERIDDINFIDRWAAGNNNTSANSWSDIPFAVSFASPFIMLFDDEINEQTGTYLGLYLESLATTATLYTITAGIVNRSRPYVYDVSGVTSDSRRISKNGQRSFYSGHVAATATATFFAAKVYSDFHPNSSSRHWVWAGAAITPATVGLLRIQAGQHFLTDVVLGYALGAATGILVPELHKNKNTRFSISPIQSRTWTGNVYSGMSVKYSID